MLGLAKCADEAAFQRNDAKTDTWEGTLCLDTPIGKSFLLSNTCSYMKRAIPLGDSIAPDYSAAYLPAKLRAAPDIDALGEADWEEAYACLWAQREAGIRADFPFLEPDDHESIIADAAALPDLEQLTEAEYAERIKGAWYGPNRRCHPWANLRNAPGSPCSSKSIWRASTPIHWTTGRRIDRPR